MCAGVPPRLAVAEGWEFLELELNSSTKYKPGAPPLPQPVPARTPARLDCPAWRLCHAGIHSTRHGAVLVLELAAETATAAIAAASASGDSVELILQYLLSWASNMGSVRITCGGGCGCEPAVVDAHCIQCTSSTLHSHAVALLPNLRSHAAPETACSSPCLVNLTVSTSGGHRFKLSRMLLQRTSGSAQPQDEIVQSVR